jgi:hypothetical protein
MTRNLLATVLGISGLALLGLAALDWARYSAFAISMLWK